MLWSCQFWAVCQLAWYLYTWAYAALPCVDVRKHSRDQISLLKEEQSEGRKKGQSTLRNITTCYTCPFFRNAGLSCFVASLCCCICHFVLPLPRVELTLCETLTVLTWLPHESELKCTDVFLKLHMQTERRLGSIFNQRINKSLQGCRITKILGLFYLNNDQYERGFHFLNYSLWFY